MTELRSQFINALLLILTALASIAAFLNFQQNYTPGKRFRLPDDGVTWVDRSQPGKSGVVKALHVEHGSPAENAGIRSGDTLIKISGQPIHEAIDVLKVLVNVRPFPYGKADYVIARRGVEFGASVIIGEHEPDPTVAWQYGIGLVYLAIGLFVYFRRQGAPKALHFLLLCLASFILSTFHYTGKLNTFDQIIYWGNVAAGIFAPTIFLHFCLTFPESRGWFRKRGMGTLIYLPGTFLLAVSVAIAQGYLRVNAMSPIELRWLIDRFELGFFAVIYLLGALALHAELGRTEEPIVRQQLKLLRNGAVLGTVPFTLMYVLPYFAGAMPGTYMRWAVVCLVFIPVTWAYAIARYRLMDVDVIFRQGYIYTLATIAVLGVFYGLFVSLGTIQNLSPNAIVALILVATFAFQPIRNWMEEVLNRYVFYRDRYDYRQTLVEFARDLSKETHMDTMLESVADRLTRTLFIRRIAAFVREPDSEEFRLFRIWGGETPENPDLSFMRTNADDPYLFFERTRHAIDVVSQAMPASVRHTIADFDLTYYIPCTVGGKAIAWLGLSRTEEGDFLSSDDLELVLTVSKYIGIAIENARLYSSLKQKVEEYERLKEFSENIVESINVGVLAVDLRDCVESWNSQIEKLTGIPREQAVGRNLSELFPAELYEKFREVEGQTGVHNIYKFTWNPAQFALGAAAGGSSSGNGRYVNGNGHSHGNSPATNGNDLTAPDRRSEVIVNIAIAPLVSRDMDEIGRLIIFDDITDRSELEQRLLQADKLSSIGLLAAGVAHEVNTPLAVISTYAQMLAKQVAEDDGKSKLLDKIAKQTFRASEIVNSLLNFSRTSPAEYIELDINKVVDETVSLVRHQIERAQVRIVIDLEPDLPLMRGNAGKLQQVFLNLVLNARDAMEGGGVLTLRTRAGDSLIRVEVQDTGQGIPSENLSRIYDPFFTTKVGRKGTGLGLSVTYGIVQEHGGSIEVNSRVGQGTTFQLDFPLVRKPVAA